MEYLEGCISAGDWNTAQLVCPVCGRSCSSQQMESIGGHNVCDSCLEEFIFGDSTVKEYSGGFLENQETEFLWWLFKGDAFLSDWDKQRWLQLGWQEWKRYHPAEAREAGLDFVRASPGEWEDYLRDY